MSRCVRSSVVFGCCLVAAGCAGSPPPNPYPPVPPAVVEVAPLPAGEHKVRRPGYWEWNNDTYQWIPGHYVTPAPGAQRWENGHWTWRNGQWQWLPGHWV